MCSSPHGWMCGQGRFSGSGAQGASTSGKDIFCKLDLSLRLEEINFHRGGGGQANLNATVPCASGCGSSLRDLVTWSRIPGGASVLCFGTWGKLGCSSSG